MVFPKGNTAIILIMFISSAMFIYKIKKLFTFFYYLLFYEEINLKGNLFIQQNMSEEKMASTYFSEFMKEMPFFQNLLKFYSYSSLSVNLHVLVYRLMRFSSYWFGICQRRRTKNSGVPKSKTGPRRAGHRQDFHKGTPRVRN